jgi:hypothetical protein
LGRLSWWAKVIPGLELGLVECAKGSLASDEYDWVLSLADSYERVAPLTSEVAILVAVAKVASSEDGGVKVWTAMVDSQLGVERRYAGANGEKAQGTTVKVVTVLKTVGRHEYTRVRRERGKSMA